MHFLNGRNLFASGQLRVYFSVFAQSFRRVNQDFNVPPLRRLLAPYRPVPLNDVIVSGWLKAASRSGVRAIATTIFWQMSSGPSDSLKRRTSTHYTPVHPKGSYTRQSKKKKSFVKAATREQVADADR